MAIIKKKDLYKYLDKQDHVGKGEDSSEILGDEEILDELVDDDGSHIEGGTHNTAANSEIKTAPGQTTDDFAQSGIQPNNSLYGLYGSPYSRGSRYVTSESRKMGIEKVKNILKEIKK